MKEKKVKISFDELEKYRKSQKLEENLLSSLINKKKGEGNIKDSIGEISEEQWFKDLVYTIYQPKNLVVFKGVLSSDLLVEQVFLSSEYMHAALGSNKNALELKPFEANRPEDYGLYYLQSGGTPGILGTNLTLTFESLFALLCLADCRRRKRALSFLMHQVEEMEILVKEVEETWEENIAFKDPRWLGGFLMGFIKEDHKLSMENGLKELAQAGFLTIMNNLVEIMEEAEILLSILERRQVILSYENYYLEAKDKAAAERLLFIKTESALFLIQELEGSYSFTSIDMDIAEEVLKTIFLVVDIAEGTETAAEPYNALGNEVDKTPSFKKEEPEKVEKSKGNICSSCGAKAHGNSKFCKICGTELKKQPEKVKKPKFCSQCGNEVSETGRFCKYCGTAIAEFEE